MDDHLENLAAPHRDCGECTACCTALAVYELNKPARWACDFVGPAGCRNYEARPASCKEFNCQWLQGELGPDLDLRPDRLGVVFDRFQSLATGRVRCIVRELWRGALDDPRIAELLRKIGTDCEIELSYRDGTWRTISTTPAVSRSVSGGDLPPTGGNRTTGDGRPDSDRI